MASLGVKDTASLLRLTRNELERAWSCGKKTIAEIEALQSGLKPEAPQESVAEPTSDLAFDDAPKEVFDTVCSSLSVRGAHTLEALGVKSLKAFMMLEKNQLMECRNCGRGTANEILQVQRVIGNSARKLAQESGDFKAEQLLNNACLAGVVTGEKNIAESENFLADVENPAPWLVGWVHDLARSRKKARAFMLRKGMVGSAPMTLERVGEQLGGISRERVRQMERAVEKMAATAAQQRRLRPLIDEIAAAVEYRGGMVGLDELIVAVLCRGENGDQLRFATDLIAFFTRLKVWKKAGLLPEEDGVIRKGDLRPLVSRLADLVKELASTRAGERYDDYLWSIDRERLKDALQKAAGGTPGIPTLSDVSDALFDAILKECRKRVKAHKNRVYSIGLWRLRFGNITQMLDTVLKQIGRPAHFTEISKRVREWRPGFSERNTHASLDRTKNALLWDRGTFVHKDNVIIPLSLIHDVERWLMKVLGEDVPFVSVYGAFSEFRSRCERAGFPSEVALYTSLRQSGNPRLTYPRLPWVYLKKGFAGRIPVAIAFEDFIRDSGGPVSQQECRDFGIGKMFLKEFQLQQLSQTVSNVIRTADWGNLHLDNAELHQESIQSLIRYTLELLTGDNHCSIKKVYRDKKVTCRSAGIDSPVMLYSVLQCFADEVFLLHGYPGVAGRRDGEETKVRAIKKRVTDFVRDSGRPCPYELLEKRFVEELGYNEYQIYSVAREPNVCLYHTGCVVHHETLGWNSAKQRQLERAADHVCRDAVRAGKYFGRLSHLVESNDLPRLTTGLYWSPALIADLLTKGGDYLVIGNAKEAFLPRRNDHDIRNLETLVAKLLDTHWGGAANLAQFERALVKAGIIKKSLTQSMLGAGRMVVIKNREIILAELVSNAQRP
ncbi:MAG: hypothetical protein SWE60_12990 [Thermodesulfobacteriota bacterium]|nr:hypothetical protein [Thermodesulfobacteriota bacterium]